MSNSCPICFEELIDKSKASPDVCDHIFCLPCLEKWSKHGSYCPVDRKRFKKIISLDSQYVIQVKPLKSKQQRVLYDVTVYCEVCKNHNGASTLLLCDCCDLGYHCKCLTPPLQKVPAGQWYCPVCTAVEVRINTAKGCTKEVQHMVDDSRKSKDTHAETDNSENNNLSDDQNIITKNNVYNVNIPETSLPKTVASTSVRNEKHIDCDKNLQDNEMTNSTNKSNIIRSERNFVYSQEYYAKKEVVSMGLRNKDNRKDGYFQGKTMDIEDASSTVRSNIAGSTMSIHNKKEQHLKKKTGSTHLFWSNDRKLRNCLIETIDLGDDSPAVQSSIVRSILNRTGQPIEKETVPKSFSNADNRNWDVETIDIEDGSSTVQSNIAKNEKSIHSMKEYAKKETAPIGLTQENHKKLKECLRETIYLGDDSPAIQNSITRCIQNRKERIKKELTDVNKIVSKKFNDYKVETVDIGDDSPASQSNFTIINIKEERTKTPVVSTRLKTMDEKKIINFEEIIYIADVSPTYLSNTAKSKKKSLDKLEQYNKMEIVLGQLQNDSSNGRNLCNGKIDKGRYSSESQENNNKSISEGSMHDSQEEESPLTNKEVSDLRTNIKRRLRDCQGGKICFKNNTFVHSNQKHPESNELVTLIKKKGKIGKHHHRKAIDISDFDSCVLQSTATMSEKITHKSQEQHHKEKKAQTCLMKLKDSLILELEEQNSKVRIDSGTSDIKSLHWKACFASKESCFRKKEIQSSDITNLWFSPKKSYMINQSKSSNNSYLEKQRKKVTRKESRVIGQQKVLSKTMSHQYSSSLNTAIHCNDKISLDSFQYIHAPINNSCDINNSTKDNLSRKFTSSKFSVFETLEDTSVSSQKYLNINRAVKAMKHTTTNSLSLFSKNFPTSKKSNSISSQNYNFLIKNLNSHEILGKSISLDDKPSHFVSNPLHNYNVRQVNYAIKAKMNLAEELKKIEKEKWTSSMKKQKKPRMAHSVTMEKFQNNLFNFPSTSVSKQLETHI